MKNLTTKARYTLWGILFGCLFPILGTILEASMAYGSVNIAMLFKVQAQTPLLWIIDTAPLFLGLFAGLLGHKTEELLAVQERRDKEQESLIKRLEIRNSELGELNDAMDGVIYTASHDLKTPVVNFKSMLTMLRMVQQRPGSEQMVREVMDKMDQSADKMQETLTDLLEVSRVERHLEEEKEEIDLDQAIDQTCESFQNLIKEADAEIDLSGLKVKKLFFSRRSLDSILQNLISNAIKYRHPDRRPVIKVTSEVLGENIFLHFTDNGLGIDLTKYQHKLFKMFSRLHNHTDGTGVGLYIVKRTIERAGGSISVDSTPQIGTTFKIQLPLTPETNDKIKISPPD